MKIRKFITSNFFLLIFFIVYWLIYNLRYFEKDYFFEPEEILVTINSDSSGYFSYIIISTLFTFIYIIHLNSFFPKIREYVVIRSGKKHYLNKQIQVLIIQTITFAFLFEFTNVLMNYISLPNSLLKNVRFSFISIIHFILIFIYFLLVGASFVLINCITSFKSISIWITSIIFCFFLGLYKFFNINGLPIRDFCIFDQWFNQGLNILPIVISVVKNLIIILISFVLSKNIFLSKDILDNNILKFEAKIKKDR